MENSTITSEGGEETQQPAVGGGSSSSNSGGGGTTEEQTPQLFCLRWNNYQSNLTNVFDQLLQNESFVDVTLACADGHTVKAHKMVLSACSPYFQSLFFENPCKHPIVILKDIKWTELKAAVEFMYKGEINVCQEQIAPLLKVAESLKIRGLADVSNEHDFAQTRDSKSPNASSGTATTETISARSPSRVSSANNGGQPPTKKRRRASADRSSNSTGEDTISVINSPSRALELVTSPSSSSVGTTSICSTNVMNSSARDTSASQHQQQSQNQAGRPSQSSTPQSPSNIQPLPLPPPPPSLPSTSSVADDMEIKPGIAEMIREEERTCERNQWENSAMKEAIKTVLCMKMGTLRASKKYNIPKTTLRRYVHIARSRGMSAFGSSDAEFEALLKKRLGRKPAFSPKLEERLVDYCVDMNERYFGLERRDISRMAVQMAMKNNLKNIFNKEGAGVRWLRSFFSRHPQLAQCTSRAKVQARKLGFTPQNVDKFYQFLQPELEKVRYAESRVFNVNEFGVCFHQNKSASNKENVVLVKGKADLQRLSAAEKSTLITAIVCTSASGVFNPLMIVLPEHCKNNSFKEIVPENAKIEYVKLDWITKEIFVRWFCHFVIVTRSSTTNPSVLVFNGQHAHSRNIHIIDMANKYGVSLVCLPPSCSLWLQPLEVSFVESFKLHYSTEVEKWIRDPKNKTQKPTYVDACNLFTIAYKETATVENAKKGFQITGILPFKKDNFTEDDFQQGEEDEVHSADDSSSDDPIEQMVADMMKNMSNVKYKIVVSSSSEECETGEGSELSTPSCSVPMKSTSMSLKQLKKKQDPE